MNTGTILQRRKVYVRISKEETLLILRAYREHPTRWADVIDGVKQNIERLPAPAQELYRTGCQKQQRDRMSVKLSKLMATRGHIENPEIRQEMEQIRDKSEDCMVGVQQPANQQEAVDEPDSPVQEVENQDVVQKPIDNRAAPAPAPQVANAQAGPAPRQDRRDAIAAGLDSDEDNDQPPRRRRRLADLIRENNELYNVFMRRTVPRILRYFGIDLDDE